IISSLRTVTHNNDLAQFASLLDHRHIDSRAALQGNLLVGVANKGENERGICIGRVQRKPATAIRNRGGLAIFNFHGNAFKRPAGAVGNLSTNLLLRYGFCLFQTGCTSGTEPASSSAYLQKSK